MILKKYPIHIKILVLVAIIFSILVINFAIVARENAIIDANYDIAYISEFGLDIGIDVPIKVPKGRLPIGDGYGQMSFNVRSSPSVFSFQNTFSLPLVQEAEAHSRFKHSVTVNVGGGGGSKTTSPNRNAGSNRSSQKSSTLGAIGNSQSTLEPFGGVAYGFPCCNGWYYYMKQCGKCAAAGVGKSQTHMAWWFSLRKWYLPTAGNPVLGLSLNMQTDCYLLLPPYCYCDCEIEADVTDYVVGTAADPSKSAQTTQ